MKLKSIILAASILICPSVTVRADSGWAAVENENLYNSAARYLKTIQLDFAGEPIYYYFQNALVELEAAHLTDEFVWMEQIHSLCNTLEGIYGPCLEHSSIGYADKYEKIRRHIMRLRDYPLHEVSLSGDVITPKAGQIDAFMDATYRYLKYKRKGVVEFLHSPRPTGNELQVLKLYSSGYIFRTKNACIGIDIAFESAYGDSDYLSEIASYLDVLYVTHPHGDHYDKGLLAAVCSHGGTIVMNSDLVATSGGHKFVWTTDHLSPTLFQGVANTSAIASAQGTTPLLMYHIVIDNWTIVHVGDNSDHSTESKFSNLEMPDVVVAPIFQGLSTLFPNLNRSKNTKDVQMTYFSAHENEYHHLIADRIPYKYMYENKTALGNDSDSYPCSVVMDAGEAITLVK